jgi:hypothetical protein
MNRALYIVLIPVTLVAIGYVVVLRMIGIAPGYSRLAGALTVAVLGIWWVARRNARKDKSKLV